MMEWILLIGYVLLSTLIYIFLQKLTMELSNEIWRFLPMAFFLIIFINGILRLFLYFLSFTNGLNESLFLCGVGIHGFFTSLIAFPVIDSRRKKKPEKPSGKPVKLLASVSVALVIFLAGITTFGLFLPKQNDQALMIVGQFMFDELHENDPTNAQISFDEHIRNSPFAYSAYLYLDSPSVSYLDEHTVFVEYGAYFQSVSGYLITDGKKSYPDSYLEIPGSGYDGSRIYIHKESDNIYSWSAGL